MTGIAMSTVLATIQAVERRGLTYGEVGRGTYVQGGQGTNAEATSFFRKEATESNKIDFGLNRPAAGNRAAALSETLQDIARSPHLDDFLAYQTDGGMLPHRQAISN